MNYSAEIAELMVQLSWGRYKRTGLQKIVEGTLTGLLFIVPFIANGTICTALLQRQRLKSVSNLLLLSLLSANLLLSLCNVPFAIVSIVFDRWVFGDILCEVTGFMTNALTASSNLSIIAIALHRYYLIVRPLSVKINQPRAKLLIAYVWFTAVVFCAPPLLGWNIYEYSPGKGYCTVDWGEGGPGLVYSVFFVTAIYLTPLASMLYIYRAIYKATQAQRLRTDHNTIRGLANGVSRPQYTQASFQGLRDKYLCGCCSRSGSDKEDNGPQKPRHPQITHATSLSLSVESSTFSQRDLSAGGIKKSVSALSIRSALKPGSIYEIKTVQNAVLLVTSFMMCLTPYYIVNLWGGFSQTAPSHVTDFVTSWMHLTITGFNPLVYGYLNRHIRRAVRKLPLCKRICICGGCETRGAGGADNSRAYPSPSWGVSNDWVSADF